MSQIKTLLFTLCLIAATFCEASQMFMYHPILRNWLNILPGSLPQEVTSVEVCALMCKEVVDCKVFSISSNRTVCTLLGGSFSPRPVFSSTNLLPEDFYVSQDLLKPGKKKRNPVALLCGGNEKQKDFRSVPALMYILFSGSAPSV